MAIGIVSLELDLHAHVVARRLREHFSVDARVFATDDYFPSGTLSIGTNFSGIVSDYKNEKLSISDIGTVWWRRANQNQKPNDSLPHDIHMFVSSEWRFSLASAWMSDFKGNWINSPQSDVNATAKTVQLRAAITAGMSVPKTIISNDYKLIRSFIMELDNKVVVKKVAGIAGTSLATVDITIDDIDDVQASMCPAVYQEKIDARLHLRVIALGDQVTSIAFSSDYLDWRRSLNFKPFIYYIEDQHRKHIIQLLRDLKLEMGILDIIIDNDGQYHFLEINPQGQFLFLENMADIDLTQLCAEFFFKVNEIGFWYRAPYVDP